MKRIKTAYLEYPLPFGFFKKRLFFVASSLLLIVHIFTVIPVFAQSLPDKSERELFEEGRRLMSEGNLEGAILALQRVLLLNPDHTPSYLILGIIYTRREELNRAIEVLKQAVDIDNNLLAGFLLLGQAYAANNENEKAKNVFERAIGIKSDFPGGHYLLGLLYLSENAPVKAAALFRKTIAIKGEWPEKKQAQQHLDALKKQGKRFFDQGMQLMERGEADRANALFEKSLKLDPENPKNDFNIGIILLQNGALDEAIISLKNTLEKQKDFFFAHLFLGEAYEKKGKIIEALLEFRLILEEIPDPSREEAVLARQKLSQIGATPEIGRMVQSMLKEAGRLLKLGDLEGAKSEFLVILTFLPRQVLVHFHLGQIALVQNKFREAEHKLKRAIAIDKTHFMSYLALGEVYERKGDTALAISTYQNAVRVRPADGTPNIRLGIIYEKKGEIKKALKAYHKVVALSGETDAPGRTLAQSRIDLYEKKFRLSYTDSVMTYDSNSTQSQNPVSEISSMNSLGISYFLKKHERTRIPLRFDFSTRFLHRTQLYFLNGGAALSFFHRFSQYSVMAGYNYRVGTISGESVTNGKAFEGNSYVAELTKSGSFPNLMTIRANFQDLTVVSNPIFSSKRLTGTGVVAHDLRLGKVKLGRLQISYTLEDNNIEANDQTRQTNTLTINYSREIVTNLSGSVGLSRTQHDFLNEDSLALSKGLRQKRRNILSSVTLGLSYRLQPGITIFSNFSRQKNRSNLSVPSSLDIVDINSGQVQSLGSYDKDLVTFGMTSTAELKDFFPEWKNLNKALTIGITTGYYRPSLEGLNRILGDSKSVISQDPNHILPSNPNFLSEARNLSMDPIKGSSTGGIEVEWEMGPRNGLVFSLSEWQGSTTRTDVIPLLLSPTEPALMVPRSARYNLTINQFILSWRYSLINNPKKGRLFFDLGLFGGSLVRFNADAVIRVKDNPIGDPFVSLGSIEARGKSFTTRAGLGGTVFIRPWLSIGLNLNYLMGTVTKLKVEREFPSGFRAIPAGLPGTSENPCFRLTNNLTQGETLNTVTCDGDQVRAGTAPQVLKIKLDGIEGNLAVRFHFGKKEPGRTAFEKFMDWGELEEVETREAWEEQQSWKSGQRSSSSSGLSFDGTLKNEVAYRINEPVTFTKALTLFRLNTRYVISPRFIVVGRGRAFYDAVYDFVDIDTISPRRFESTVLTQLPQNPSPEEVEGVDIDNSRGVEINQEGIELREFYIDAHFKAFDLRIGRQIVRWGVVPGARVTDEINPFDFGEFILREVEDRFIPLMMLKADFFAGDTRFEVIWITEVVPHKPAPSGSEFEQFQILPGFVGEDDFLDSSLNFDPDALENTEIAGQIVHNFNGLEVGFTGFYHWDDFPASFRTIEGSGGGGFQSSPAVTFTPRLNRIVSVGTTLSKSFGRIVLNAEFAYTFGKLFGTLLAVPDSGDSGGDPEALGELQRDFLKYAAGLDFALFGTDMSVQVLQQYIPDWAPVILQDRIDTVLAHFMRKTFMNESLVTHMLTLYFLNEEDFLLRPAIEARLSDKVKTVFGGDFFVGDRGEKVGQFDFIGFFKDSSRLYLEVIYSF